MDAPYRCLRACRASPPAGVGPEEVPLTRREPNPPLPKRETTLTIALQTLISSQFLPPYDPEHIVSGTHSVYAARYVSVIDGLDRANTGCILEGGTGRPHKPYPCERGLFAYSSN